MDLRPIDYQNDSSTLERLNLELLAYWIINTIRHQLKAKKINHHWQEIIKITNTQKLVSTAIKDLFENTIEIKNAQSQAKKLLQIYLALNYKKQLFVRKKFVVPKSETLQEENYKKPHFTG